MSSKLNNKEFMRTSNGRTQKVFLQRKRIQASNGSMQKSVLKELQKITFSELFRDR